MEVTKKELRRVMTKLDDVQVELLRLRAQLLPEERPTRDERRQIVHGRQQIRRGQSASLAHLRRRAGLEAVAETIC